jgi:hypothetical protein
MLVTLTNPVADAQAAPTRRGQSPCDVEISARPSPGPDAAETA